MTPTKIKTAVLGQLNKVWDKFATVEDPLDSEVVGNDRFTEKGSSYKIRTLRTYKKIVVEIIYKGEVDGN